MKKVIVTNFFFLFFVLFSAGLYAQPKLSNPADNAAGVSIEPTISWESVTGATAYRLQISTDKTFATVTYETVLNDPTTSWKPANAAQRLENNKQYYWHVRASNTPGGAYSETRTFYTAYAVVPTLIFPVGGLTLYTSSVTLSWNPEPYTAGVKYDVFYSKSLSAGQLNTPTTLAENITATTKNFGTLDPGTTYYWQVRSKTSTDAVISYSIVDSFKTSALNGPVVPVAAWPVGGATEYTKTPTLYFYLNSANPGLQFNVYYSKSSPVTLSSDTTGWNKEMNVKLPALTPGEHYYWRVQSRLISDNTKLSVLSEEADFVVDSSLALSAQIPVQGWPVGGATVYSTDVKFSWYMNTSAAGLWYKIKYKEISSGAIDSTIWTDKNSITIPNFTPGESYQWWVRSSPNKSWSEWSQPDSFTIDPGMQPSANVPVLSWPVQGATVYSNKPTLYWYTLSGASGLQYQVQYSTTKTFGSPVTLDTTINKKFTFSTPLTEGLTYYWRVGSRVGSSGSFDYSAADSFVVNAPAAVEVLQPIVSSPYDGAIVSSISPKLVWYLDGSSFGLKYHLKISNYPFVDDDNLIFDGDLDKMEYIAAGLAPGATYAWKVYSFDAEHPSIQSAPSDIATFTVSAGASGAFVPLTGSPAGGVKVKTLSPVLTWYLPASSSNSKYGIEYSLNKDMSNAQSITNISSTAKTLSGLTSGSTYYWRVQSFNKDGKPSAFSSVESFVASSLTGVEKNSITPTKFEVAQNYPNPFNPSTTIKVSLPAASFLSVKIYNMLGQEVRTLLSEQAQAGVHSIIWHGEDNFGSILPSGAYIYRVTAGKNVTSGKMMFLK